MNLAAAWDHHTVLHLFLSHFLVPSSRWMQWSVMVEEHWSEMKGLHNVSPGTPKKCVCARKGRRETNLVWTVLTWGASCKNTCSETTLDLLQSVWTRTQQWEAPNVCNSLDGADSPQLDIKRSHVTTAIMWICMCVILYQYSKFLKPTPILGSKNNLTSNYQPLFWSGSKVEGMNGLLSRLLCLSRFHVLFLLFANRCPMSQW